jgi:hypothetical protein
MTEPTDIATLPETMPTAVVALTQDQMAAAQATLVAWCDERIAEAETEAREMNDIGFVAKERGFSANSAAVRERKAKARMVFYGKVRLAIEAGYVIVPNFPVNIFAIRTNRKAPSGEMTRDSYGHRDHFEQGAPGLPVGDGRNVSNVAIADRTTDRVPVKPGSTEMETEYIAWPVDFDDRFELGMPVHLVRPQILESTSEAMEKLLFDEFGLVRDDARMTRSGRAKASDPIIVGRIIDRRNGRMFSFFVAWWLDKRAF